MHPVSLMFVFLFDLLSLLNIIAGSIVGHKGNIGQSIYSASKAGLFGFSKSLAKEVAIINIRVNVVAPGIIQTDMTSGLEEDSLNKMIPLGRFGDPEEDAQSVLFLLESPYITGHVYWLMVPPTTHLGFFILQKFRHCMFK
ncbi:carbonyl reductase family member 4-like [Xenopus laevis]|uniref:3-ketoacyl-[acyl-carrier-protein] reductase beta subunit n=1 Tax=Xenopus laevis TaxID=8355 RepID=A0A8J0U789_XENLA|nr:carbonyl reductase family member 4-like [Xenopus laevis]